MSSGFFFGNSLLWGVLAFIIGSYHYAVPSDHVKLPSYRDLVKGPNSPFQFYPEKTWEEQGYIDLPFGTTNYYMIGPKNGTKIVIVHGITVPSISIQSLINELARKGFRILTYDLYGRGYSDSPGALYSDSLYVTQLLTLMERLGWANKNEPVHLMGVSLGGAISVKFVQHYPDLVGKVILVAPAGLLKTIPMPAKLLRLPFIGKLFMFTVGRFVLVDHIKNQPTLNNNDDQILNKLIGVHQAIYHKGFQRAFLSTIRYFPVEKLHGAYMDLDKSHHENVMVIWGEEDEVIPYKQLIGTLKTLLTKSKVISVATATHHVATEFHKEIAGWVDEFCKKS